MTTTTTTYGNWTVGIAGTEKPLAEVYAENDQWRMERENAALQRRGEHGLVYKDRQNALIDPPAPPNPSLHELRRETAALRQEIAALRAAADHPSELHEALGQVLSVERRRWAQELNAALLAVAKLEGQVEVLRSMIVNKAILR